LDRMAHRRSDRTLVLAFCAVVISFVASTIYTEQKTTEVDAAATQIATVAAPGIEQLATLRAEVHQLMQLLTEYVEGASRGSPPDRAQMVESRLKVQQEMRRYLALPSDPEGAELWNEVHRSLKRLDDAVGRVLKLVDGGEPTRARQSLDVDARRAAEAARVALIQAIQHSANYTHNLALRIQSIRSRSALMAYLLDAASIVFGGIAIALAVLQVRQYTRLLESQRELLARRNEELEIFAGRVAHDVLGPLTSVSTFLAMAERKLGGADNFRRSLERAQRGLQRSRRIVHDLLEFARAGARPALGAHAELNEILRELERELQATALEGGAELRVDIPQERILLACSPGVSISLIENLVRNAIKYIGDAPVREIRVGAQLKKSSVRVEVEDTGPGLPPGMHQAVFEPFVRATGASAQPGIGLGLATVKRLAEAHGGAVGVESQPGKGCLFWFELPRAEPESAAGDSSGAQRKKSA